MYTSKQHGCIASGLRGVGKCADGDGARAVKVELPALQEEH